MGWGGLKVGAYEDVAMVGRDESAVSTWTQPRRSDAGFTLSCEDKPWSAVSSLLSVATS